MARVSKEFEIEMNDGRIVNVDVTVNASFEGNYGADADGNRGTSAWFIDDMEYEADEELNEADKVELEQKLDELVNSEDWDFADDFQDEDLDF